MARQHLRATDQVVFEATTHAWYLHDLLQPLVARVVVADPGKLHAKIATPVKTDKRDTLAMAELLAASDLQPKQKRFADVIARSGSSLL
ncbi:MAG: hypothetical protein HC884_19485, partial [Chloroflexaceae bacterium]|nr:hypothetical protein [Chloroflexaceae bacterium]